MIKYFVHEYDIQILDMDVSNNENSTCEIQIDWMTYKTIISNLWSEIWTQLSALHKTTRQKKKKVKMEMILNNTISKLTLV